MKTLLTAALLLSTSTAFAEVHEIQSYADAKAQIAISQANVTTWIIFDIDNTLLKPTTMMGSHQWGDYMKAQAEAVGQSKADANAFQHSAFSRVQPSIQVEVTEPLARSVVDALQSRGLTTFALTARDESIASTTLSQTRSLGYDFSKSEPLRNQSFSESKPARFFNGVLFSGDTPKGELLKLLIAEAAVRPTKVIFFDDRAYNLDSVGKSLGEIGVEFVGFRYGGADGDMKNFRPDISNVQWLEFKQSGKALSNLEAMKLVISH